MIEEQILLIQKQLKAIEDHVSEIREIQNVDIKNILDRIIPEMQKIKNEIIEDFRSEIKEISH